MMDSRKLNSVCCEGYFMTNSEGNETLSYTQKFIPTIKEHILCAKKMFFFKCGNCGKQYLINEIFIKDAGVQQ